MRRCITKALLYTCIATAPLFGGSFAYADRDQAPAGVKCDQEGKFAGKHHKREFERLARQLGVTEPQKSQIKGVFNSFRTENRPLFATLKSERRELRNLIHSGTADEAAIRAQSAKIATVQADLAVARGALAKQVQSVLTPDQVTKLKVLLQEREQKMEKFRGKHRHGWMEGEGPM